MTKLQSISYENAVANFMNKYGQPMRIKPEIPTRDELSLRSRLIEEEAIETRDAINMCSHVIGKAAFDGKTVSPGDEQSLLIEVADGLADLLYVTFGTALSFGIPIESVFAEVHRSNMTKSVLGHDSVGKKVEKGNYSRPQIGTIIELARRK